jgi:hypothetical protein
VKKFISFSTAEMPACVKLRAEFSCGGFELRPVLRQRRKNESGALALLLLGFQGALKQKETFEAAARTIVVVDDVSRINPFLYAVK